MKSIIFNFVLCLFPCVIFSSTLASTNNPIVLPTTATTTDDDDNGVVLLPEVLDRNGEPLKTDEEYVILNTLYGGGAVYLANVLNTTCPTGVVLHNSGTPGDGTPVKFFTKQQPFNNVVREMDYINIMFSVSSKSCVNETVWKVDAPDPEGIRFVVTGGTLGNPGPDTINNWFKVEKFITTMPGYHYRLRHCPVQFLCPLCNINDCRDVGAKADSGYDRLAVTNQPIPFGFEKVRKKDA